MATLAFSLLVWTGCADSPRGMPGRPASARSAPSIRRIPITPSRQTTYFSGPVLPDGTIDYVAAQNAYFSNGVTPENNVARILFAVLGSRAVQKPYPTSALKEIGLRLPPSDEGCFVPLDEYVEQSGETRGPERLAALKEKLGSAMDTLWSASDYPVIADWLSKNRRPLDRLWSVPEGGRYYTPVVSDYNPPTLGDALTCEGHLMLKGVAGDLARAMAARATLKFQLEDARGAWRDLMALRRLGLAIRDNPDMTFFALSIETSANDGTNALATSGRLSGALAREFLSDLESLPARKGFIEGTEVLARCDGLDLVMNFARGGPGVLDECKQTRFWEGRGFHAALPWWIEARERIDWDEVLRTYNLWYDRLVSAIDRELRMPSSDALAEYEQKQEEFWVPFIRELIRRGWNGEEEEEACSSAVRLILERSNGSGPANKTDVSRRVSVFLVCLFIPDMQTEVRLEQKIAEQTRLTVVAMALAAYKAERREYPEALSTLSPAYLKSVPIDRFTGKPLTYRRTDSGYILYTLGPNRRDDNGKYEGEMDDISVHTGPD